MVIDIHNFWCIRIKMSVHCPYSNPWTYYYDESIYQYPNFSFFSFVLFLLYPSFNIATLFPISDPLLVIFPIFTVRPTLPIIIHVKGLHFFLLKFILPFEFLSYLSTIFFAPFTLHYPERHAHLSTWHSYPHFHHHIYCFSTSNCCCVFIASILCWYLPNKLNKNYTKCFLPPPPFLFVLCVCRLINALICPNFTSYYGPITSLVTHAQLNLSRPDTSFFPILYLCSI